MFNKENVRNKIGIGDTILVPKGILPKEITNDKDIQATVVEKYPYVVLFQKNNGIRFCLTYFDCEKIKVVVKATSKATKSAYDDMVTKFEG